MTEYPNNYLEQNTTNISKKDPLRFVNSPEKRNTSRKNHSYLHPQPKSKIYRQGDILFRKIGNLPNQLKEKKDNIIAEGEESGHAHTLLNGILYEVIHSDSLYIKSEQNTKIIHQEHLPIKLESGNYEVLRQREYLGSGARRQITRLVRD